MKIAKCSQLPRVSVDGYALLPYTLAWRVCYEKEAERLVIERVVVLERRCENREFVVVAPARWETPGSQDSHAETVPVRELHVSDDSAVACMVQNNYLPRDDNSPTSAPQNADVFMRVVEVKQ